MTESRTAVYCKHNLHTPHPENGVEMDETQMQDINAQGKYFPGYFVYICDGCGVAMGEGGMRARAPITICPKPHKV